MTTEIHREGGDKDGEGRHSAAVRPDFPLGTHLVVSRRGYLHHGIYAGDGRVVHYAGLSGSWRRGPVEEVPLEQFAAGRSLLIKPVGRATYTGTEVVARARSRLGENSYRLISNNCEHFCEWCIGGAARSEQVDDLLALPPLNAMRSFTALVRRFARESTGSRRDTRAA